MHILILGDGPAHRPLLGGKAAALSELAAVGLPVPPGFAITTAAFRAGASAGLTRAILEAFDALGAARVAVRSSAVAEDAEDASWAGQLESYLGINRAGLMRAVQGCWASATAPRARAYAAARPTSAAAAHGKLPAGAVAVLVQAMVPATHAGVMFTADPITGDTTKLVIEAVPGLAETLVQGSVTPELVTLNKATGALLEHHPSPASGAGLAAAQLAGLVALARRIEAHFGRPQDIEWAAVGDQLFVIQSRPITTL
jgi:rifampicin phosphotransferase